MPEMLEKIEHDVVRYSSGKTLPGSMYLDPDFFPFEMEHVLDKNWWVGRFSSELADSGDFALVQIAKSSIILCRGRDGEVRGFYNSCRHRGAVLCQQSSGRMARITCPYHAWSFGLDGALLSAPHMYEDFDKSDYPLHSVHVREEAGIIFINLSKSPPDFDAFFGPHRPHLAHYGFPDVKIVERRTYPIEANWKLAVENLLECYHCGPSHPGLCVVEGRDELAAAAIDPAAPRAAELLQKLDHRFGELEAQETAHGLPTSEYGMNDETGGYAALRYRLAKGFDTGTMDGRVILPFLGNAATSIGSGLRMAFSHTTFLQIYADHAVCLSYLPQTSGRTLVEQVWIVNANATVDPETRERLTSLWNGTTLEDGALAENQVLGISQPVYVPGPLSAMEPGTKSFLDWYDQRMKRGLAAARSNEASGPLPS